MIITNDDINEFVAAIETVFAEDRYRENIFGAYFEGREEEIQLNDWLSNNPQVLIAGANFQEWVGSHELPIYRTLVKEAVITGKQQPAFRHFEGSWIIASHRGPEGIFGYPVERMSRALEENDQEFLDSYVPEQIATPDEIIRKAEKYIDNPLVDATTFVSPALWTPNSQDEEKQVLQNTAVPIIRAIQEENCELRSLHWKQLEDIVAEVLRSSGMEIHSVRENPQGGRDIIARTRLVPGELMTIAVEVKHKEVVSRPDLQKALYQNAQFPALMFVTSGRFSAGIIREAQRSENRLRLFLKDGVAIRDLIKSYKF